jgi:hypothetical protein
LLFAVAAFGPEAGRGRRSKDEYPENFGGGDSSSESLNFPNHYQTIPYHHTVVQHYPAP